MPFRLLKAQERQRVEVRTEDRLWVIGYLEATREIDGDRAGLVRYRTVSGDPRIEWVGEDRLRGAQFSEP
jgi:hypothetical protein